VKLGPDPENQVARETKVAIIRAEHALRSRRCRYLHDFNISLKFADGSEGEIDLAGELWGPVFEPLKDEACFRNFSIAEYGTICWPNGADLAPEFLHESVRAHA
jgi:hypothetical protein